MSELLTNILHMSLTGSIVILVVLLARVLMKKMPKKYMYLLWGIVGIRLLCPITLESSFSIFNIKPIKASVETVKDLPLIQYGQGAAASEASKASVVAAERTAASVTQNMTPFILTVLWAGIAVGILVYVTYQYVAFRRSLRDVKQVKPGLYSGCEIDYPFVIGLFRPKIYMPAGLTDEELEYLVLHEKTHIRRGDIFFKMLGLAVLVIHWFNPLVWLAYSLFVRDMEMSCDEEVIARLGDDVKADYSMSLVSFARKSNSSRYIVVPVAFSNKAAGGKEVKMRIKNVLGYNGTSKLVTTLALVLVAGVGLVCLSNARTRADENEPEDELTATESSDVIADEEQPADDEALDVEASDAESAEETGDAVDVAVEDGTDETTVTVYVEDNEEEPAPVTDTADNTDYEIRNNNILGISVPIYVGAGIDAELNLPAGTSIDDDPELSRFLAPGEPLSSDSYCVYYKNMPSRAEVMKYIEAVEQAGFSDNAAVMDGAAIVFTGYDNDGHGCIVEYDDGVGNFRISFFRVSDELNAFQRVG